jgi:polyhydroxyalkanoate synthesis regulator phasin
VSSEAILRTLAHAGGPPRGTISSDSYATLIFARDDCEAVVDRKGRTMSPRRIAALAVSSALVAGGTGVAIAAVSSKDDRAKAETSILEDAAKRLDVTPEKLRDALAAAQDAQVDKAVKDGKLTQEQADAIKARRKQSGRVLGGGPLGGPHPVGPGGPLGGPGPRFGPPGHGFGERPFGGAVGLELAKALGVTRAELGEQLRAGKSIADIAKAQGKSLSDVRTALKAAAKAQLDQAVKDGKLTQERADKLRAHIDDGIDRLGTRDAPGPRLRMRRHAPPFLDPTP